MDEAGWWNTKGQLGRLGALALRRGFPRTYRFAQARSVFAVARQRCTDLIDTRGMVTLWNLPAPVEEEFDAAWESWIDASPEWEPFFAELENLPASDLLAQLERFELVSADTAAAARRLKRSAGARAIEVARKRPLDGDLVDLLAAAFSIGEASTPIVPFASLPDDGA